MQALTFHGRRDLRHSELATPEPGPGKVRSAAPDCLLSQGLIDFNIDGHFADLSAPHPLTDIGLGYMRGQQLGEVSDADVAELVPRQGELALRLDDAAELTELETIGHGLLRGAADRDGSTALVVKP
ncbi:MAG: hypothetical protein AAF682_18535 [Planctomycetota bacterium]